MDQCRVENRVSSLIDREVEGDSVQGFSCFAAEIHEENKQSQRHNELNKSRQCPGELNGRQMPSPIYVAYKSRDEPLK